MSQGSPIKMTEVTDNQEILPLLESDRRWSAYALCDLDPPFRNHARFIGATRDSALCALVLVYAPPDFKAVLPYGDIDGVKAIFQTASGLPDQALVIALPDLIPAAEAHFDFNKKWTMHRMGTDPEHFHRTASSEQMVRLTADDLPAVLNLYRAWPETVFTPSMLAAGIYYGAYSDGSLVGIAGTHALSAHYRTGAIGNVYTHPGYRGRGLATATTGAVAGELFRMGVRDVVLNVHTDNDAAIAAYQKLGFSVHLDFVEGPAKVREPGSSD
jgi:ribosomal protein S18 acetylase RimI-like enzyme